MDQSKIDKVTEKNNVISRDRAYSDVSTVESQKDNLIPEEFPEGTYGSAINSEVLGKKNDFLESQSATSAFTYENKDLHEGIPRIYPMSHPTHDYDSENNTDKQE